jgi:hypothetical protein
LTCEKAMSLYRHTKLPPPPELGEKTFWDYFPRRSARRVLFLLIALFAVLVLKHSGRWTFGGLLDGPRRGEPAGPVYRIKVNRPGDPQPAQPTPDDPTDKSTP